MSGQSAEAGVICRAPIVKLESSQLLDIHLLPSHSQNALLHVVAAYAQSQKSQTTSMTSDQLVKGRSYAGPLLPSLKCQAAPIMLCPFIGKAHAKTPQTNQPGKKGLVLSTPGAQLERCNLCHCCAGCLMSSLRPVHIFLTFICRQVTLQPVSRIPSITIS